MTLTNGEQVTLKMIDGAAHFFRDLYVEEIADKYRGVHRDPLTHSANVRSARNS